jgi:hypothetical protein
MFMSNELHHTVWLSYRSSVDHGHGAGAGTRFQAAVDAILCSFPGVDAPSACKEAARMVMMRLPGIGARRRFRPPIPSMLPFSTLAAHTRRDASAHRRR